MFPSNIRILIVDDMKTMRLVLRKALNDLGYQDVTEMPDGEAAWIEAQRALGAGTPYHLIISDWLMPRTKGINLLNRVRGSKMKATPFLMLTGENETESIREAIAAGVTGYLLKPFQPEQLKQKMEAAYAWSQGAQGAAKKAG
jgi:two-component system chemotaxis response regulator CheY